MRRATWFSPCARTKRSEMMPFISWRKSSTGSKWPVAGKRTASLKISRALLRLLEQARELERADRQPARRPWSGEPRRVPCRRRRIYDVAFVRREVADGLDVVADLSFEHDPPLGGANVEVSLVVRIVRRQVLLVAPDRLRPHVVVLYDVLAVELRIFLGFEQVQMRLVVHRVCARRHIESHLHHREARHLGWPRVADGIQSLEVLLIRRHPQSRRRPDDFG